MDYIKLSDFLLPDVKERAEDMEKKYSERSLPDSAVVARIAPSPTGFMHLGNLYGALIDERLAHQSNGVFYLRIEDTDQKREVEGAFEGILNIFKFFNLNFDEGASLIGDKGDYAPYTQSKRINIYHIFAKELIKKGLCYPCFCSEDDIDNIKKKQQEKGENPGYYGTWAKCRSLTFEEIKQKINSGQKYILRLKSGGDENRRIFVRDLIKGELTPPENIRDEVVIKSDGLPTYHFAHVVDDHLMRTTHVVRDESWLPSLPTHIQLFEAMGWQAPHYLHTAQILKQDGNSKRKLSKRKDPEFALEFYKEKGYFTEAVIEYLMTLLNSNFEEWRMINPKSDLNDFKFTTEKLSASGALFDLNKLNDVSKNVVSLFSAEKIYNDAVIWSESYDKELYRILVSDKEYVMSILNIGRNDAKPRKDIAVLSQIKDYISYFFDELFNPDYKLSKISDNLGKLDKQDVSEILEQYKTLYNEQDDQTQWFDKIKLLASQKGFAEMKVYKKNPDSYKGHVGDFSSIIRVAICGRGNTPDMYIVLKIMGKEKITDRIDKAIKFYKENEENIND